MIKKSIAKGFILEINEMLNKILRYDVSRFVVVGISTVLIDFIVYLFLFYLEFDITLSKGISFTTGAIFAYFANRSFTFQSSKKGVLRFLYFALLYISTLITNVVSNEIILNLFSNLNYSLLIAFVLATTISATLNFIGMKYIVFSSR